MSRIGGGSDDVLRELCEILSVLVPRIEENSLNFPFTDNKDLYELIWESGLANEMRMTSHFLCIHAMNFESLKIILNYGYTIFGIKSLDKDSIKFILDPTITVPYTYANSEKTIVHRSDSGMFYQHRSKDIMKNPVALKFLLRSCYYYKEELFHYIEGNTSIPKVLLEELCFQMNGKSVPSDRAAIRTCQKQIVFFIRSNLEIFKKTLEICQEGFEKEIGDKIFLKSPELLKQNINPNDYFNYVDNLDSGNFGTYKLEYEEDFITPFRNGSVNSLFGLQFARFLNQPRELPKQKLTISNSKFSY